MASQVMLVAYLVLGCGAAVGTLSEHWRIGPFGARSGAILMLLLWPFLLPTALFRDEPAPARNKSGSARARRIDLLLEQVRAGWRALEPRSEKEDELVSRFVAHLHLEEARVSDLDLALADPAPSIAERLAELRAASDAHVCAGIEVLEEMAAQLTLLRFSERPADGEDARAQVEHLLARVEALAGALA